MLKDLENKVKNINLEDKMKGLYSNYDQEKQNSIAALKELDKIISNMNFTFLRKINHSIEHS
jgi:hypothetical protein